VFAGPVHRTGKNAETEPEATKAIGPLVAVALFQGQLGCQLPQFWKCVKPLKTSCNWSFHSIYIITYISEKVLVLLLGQSPGQNFLFGEGLYTLWLGTDLLVMFWQSGTTLPHHSHIHNQ
jgi:hypothetical protein